MASENVRWALRYATPTACSERGRGATIRPQMQPRYLPILVPVLSLAVLSGCGILKKKKKTDPGSTSSSSGSITTAAGDFDALNKADISRFGDESKLAADLGFVRQLVTVRTAPNEGGTTVGVIDPDKPVNKYAERLGYTLVTFDRVGSSQKWAGWIPNESFSSTAILPGTKPVATATATATGTATGLITTGTAKPPTGGQCTFTLASSGFSGKSSCTFDEKIRSNQATLKFPCDGGSASASFSNHTFNGTASKTSVAISRANTFDFKGCQFRTIQTITGSPPSLRWSYTETILPNQGTKCNGMSTCTASANISANP